MSDPRGAAPGVRRHLPPLLFLLGMAGLLVARERPAATLRVLGNQVSVMLAIDVSAGGDGRIGARNQMTYVQGQLIDGVDEQALQSVASGTGGHYFYAEAAGQLQQIYTSLGSSFGWRYRHLDLTIPILGLGTAIVAAGGLLSLLWFRLLP